MTPAAETRAQRSRQDGRPMLAVRGLRVRYGTAADALDGVDLDVRKGRITAVLGSNGAGKTTLLRAISGVLHHHGGAVLAGTVLLDGRDIGPLGAESRTRAGIVQVPEGRRVFGGLSVEDNLRVGAAAGGLNRGERDAAYRRVFSLFGVLADKRRQPAALLSGGEQQMLAIGRALMAQPEVLLLDEPTLGLAPMLIEQVADLITTINSSGVTIALVEQNAAIALERADDAYVLAAGSVALRGPAAQLRDDDRVRRLYIGDDVDPPADSGPATQDMAPSTGSGQPVVRR